MGAFIYDNLLQQPNTKIKGQLVKIIERKFYKEELEAILTEQCKYHKELTNAEILKLCVLELYKKNKVHQNELLSQDIKKLIINDVLFYQRPLKSNKHLISNCPYEYYNYIDKETGEIKKQGIKCIARSNPYFQEFRLWQFILNLKLYNVETGEEVTVNYLKTAEDYVNLFSYLTNLTEIKQDKLLKEFFHLKPAKLANGKKGYKIYWNYISDKAYPCNETRFTLLKALKKANLGTEWLDKENREYKLWHLLYSVENSKDSKSALEKWNCGEEFVKSFLTVKPFKKEYGAYSEKAIKKLLSLMRMGSMWSEEAIDAKTKENINKIIDRTADSDLLERMGLEENGLRSINQFTGLPTWLACYVVYGQHSEVNLEQRWKTPEDLMAYVKNFKQHSLRNPIVEKCVLETLRTVHDIWKEEGQIDEIHIELGRNMKSTAEQRERTTKQILQNENTNLRIKYLLEELKKDAEIKNVKPHSPSQQELLKIYEEGALMQLNAKDPIDADIIKISTSANPTQKELERYKLWLEQKYRSPYTGKCISLSKLFTEAYQIEHVIPKSRYYDDSFSNKVICEAEVNSLKNNLLGCEFIQKYGGQVVQTTMLGKVTIFKEHEYTDFVNSHYNRNKIKKEKLLLTEVPENFINRQLNDARYISKFIKTLLSNIVREEGEKEAISKNVIVCNGVITDKLKKDWELDKTWNAIITPRFERLNKLTGTKNFGDIRETDKREFFQPDLPLELQKGFSKKRIDHRHHAMDALVIACTSRNIVNYFNSVSSANDETRYDLKRMLCEEKNKIKKPWKTFNTDAKTALDNLLVSFKSKIRILSKASNFYEKYDENGKKVRVKQQANNLWSVRKPLHKDTIYGHVNLRRKEQVQLKMALGNISTICNRDFRKYILSLQNQGIVSVKELENHFKNKEYVWNNTNVSEVEVWRFSDEKKTMGATRKSLDTSFNERKVLGITDTGIQKILLNYLKAHNNNPEEAFTPEGIVELNNNIALYNDGKAHKPILKVRVAETIGAKVPLGERGCKTKQFAESQKGTNLYFAIYEDKEGNRSFETISLRTAMERQKQGIMPVPPTNEKGNQLKFYLSPQDLVYVPEEGEEHLDALSFNKERIYKMVSSNSYQCFFVPFRVAKSIVDKYEFSSKNKMECSIDGEMIKNVCWKLEVDRLGKIKKIIK